MPILDANGRPLAVEKPDENEKKRTMMLHLPVQNVDAFAEGTGQNVQKLCTQLMQFNPISALVLAAQTVGVMFNSINFTTVEEKVEAEKMIRAVLDNAIANGDDYENPTPALQGNVLQSAMTH